MRVFKRYLPLKVAKHVKTYYQGRLYIQDSVCLEFRHGRLLGPVFDFNSSEGEQRKSTLALLAKVNEVNSLISQMSNGSAA